MGSWLKETYIISSLITESNNRKNLSKTPCISSQKAIIQAVIPGNFKRRYKRSPYDSGVLIYKFTVVMCILFNRLVMSRLEVVYRRFFQFWLIFPNKNYQSRSKEYNFNWCWHRTLPLKKKRFCIFENLLIRSGTTTKVLSCLKIPLTSMRFIASCFIANSSLPSPSPAVVSLSPCRNSFTASVAEFF